MVQNPPMSIRPGAERLAEIDAWASGMGMARHAAVLALIDAGLGREKNSKGGPSLAEVVEAAAPAMRAARAKMAKRGALEVALEKGLPIVRGSDPKLDTGAVPVAGGKMAEPKRDTFPSWMRGKK